MLYILIIVTIVVLYLFIRLFTYKRELKKVNDQLRQYNDFSTEKKIDVSLADRDMEILGIQINRLIDHYVSADRNRLRSENELQQAVANISHDLRTPLTSIKGYIQMAEPKDISEAQRSEYLKIAAGRTKRLEQLVNDFFELSKIESGDYKLSSETFNLKNHFEEVMLGLYTSFSDMGIEPEIIMPEADVFIHTDPSAVSRVLENLLSNALRYSDGAINAGLVETEENVQIYVENSSQDLDGRTDLNLFFDRFYVADKSRTDKSTGLGLSIAKSLMEKMGGTIGAEYGSDMLTIRCEWPKDSGGVS